MTSWRTKRQLVGWILVVVAFTPAVRGQSGTAKGMLTADAEKVALTTATAVGYRATNGQVVSVLLSDKAPDAKSFAEDTRIGSGESYVPGLISGAWKSQHFTKHFSGFTFTFNEAGRIIDEEILIGGKNKTFSLGGDEYVLELTSKGPKLAGRIRTKTPVVDTGSRKVGLDVTFEAPLTTIGK